MTPKLIVYMGSIIFLCFIRAQTIPDQLNINEAAEVKKSEKSILASEKPKNPNDVFKEVNTMGDLPDIQPFDYPKELDQFTALFRVEIETNGTKEFNYQIFENTTNCHLQFSFFVSDLKIPSNTTHRLSLKIFNPNGLLVESFSYSNESKKQKELKLKLDTVGKYHFVMKSKNDSDIVVDLVFGFSECYSTKTKLHKKDFVTFSNRFKMGAMKQTVSLLVCN